MATPAPTDPLAGRHVRQSAILEPEVLQRARPLVVGVGAVGSLVARQLAHLGCGSIGLCDPDIVNVENLSCQGYRECDLGRPKVEATAEQLAAIDGSLRLELHVERFRRSVGRRYDVIFCCVDRIATRASIWQAVKESCTGFFDARVKGGDTIRILVARDGPSRLCYGQSLFAQRQAQAGPCTARMTIYGAFVAAGLLVHQYAQMLRGLPLVEADLLVNLAAGEMAATAF